MPDLSETARLVFDMAAVHRGSSLDALRMAERLRLPVERVLNAIEQINGPGRWIELENGCFSLARPLGPEQDMAVHEHLTHALMARGLAAEAQKVLYRAYLLHQLNGDQAACAQDLGNIATLLLRDGQLDRARSIMGQVLELHRELGDESGMARDLANLGVMESRQARPQAARASLEAALELFERLGEEDMIAKTRANLDAMNEET